MIHFPSKDCPGAPSSNGSKRPSASFFLVDINVFNGGGSTAASPKLNPLEIRLSRFCGITCSANSKGLARTRFSSSDEAGQNMQLNVDEVAYFNVSGNDIISSYSARVGGISLL